MADIGSFKKSGSEFQGEIVTLSVQTKNVRIVPEANRANDNAPSHRVFVGRAEIGAAWSSAPTRAATTSRSSWTSCLMRRSTPTCSTTRRRQLHPLWSRARAERRLNLASPTPRPVLRAGL